METRKILSRQRKEKKGRSLHSYLFGFRTYFFLFLINCLSVTKSDYKIKLTFITVANPQILSNEFIAKNIEHNAYVIDDSTATCSPTTCPISETHNQIMIEFTGPIQSCKEMFQGLNTIKNVDLTLFDFSQVTDMDCMFKGCSELETIDFGEINTGLVSSMQRLFEGCKKLQSIDLSKFNFNPVKRIDFMFTDCELLKTIPFGNTKAQPNSMAIAFKNCKNLKSIDISNFDTSNVDDMQQVFDGCSSLEKINLGTFNTSNVKTMYALFSGCRSLTSMDISSFDTSKLTNIKFLFKDCKKLSNLTLGNINPSSLRVMSEAFCGCDLLISIDLSNWDLSSITEMSSTFRWCANLENITFGDVKTDNLIDMQHLFADCPKLTSVDLSKFNYNKVNNMYGMFFNCHKLVGVTFGNSVTSSLINAGVMFQHCQSLPQVDLSNFDLSKIETTSAMFLDCSTIQNITFRDTSTPCLKNMEKMFHSCRNLPSIDLSKFDFSLVTTMEEMFHNCLNLEEMNFGNKNTPNLNNIRAMFQYCEKLPSMDLSDWDFSKVKDMGEMFQGCRVIDNIKFGSRATSSLERMQGLFKDCIQISSLDLSKFDTKNVEDLSNVFRGCTNLISVDLSNFDTSKVKTMEAMFYGCSNIKNITFGNKDTSSLENLHDTFCFCSNLESVDLSYFNTSNVKTMEAMFYSCSSIKFLNLSNFETTKIENMKSMFQNSGSLKYLNIYLFKFDSTVNWENIRGGLRNDVIYCILDEPTKDLILIPNEYWFCHVDCSNINFKKVDSFDKKCLEDCTDSDNNKFDYNDKCYNKCPQNTLELDHLCIDSNSASFDQHHVDHQDGEPLGYYLDSDDLVYRKCYVTCKSCYGKGDEDNHKCTECITDYKFLNDFENDTNCYPECSPKYYYFDDSRKHHCTPTNACPTEYNILISQKGRCIDKCENDNIYKYDYHGTCYNRLIVDTTILEPVETTNVEKNLGETTYIEPVLEGHTTYIEPALKETTNVEKNVGQTTYKEQSMEESTIVEKDLKKSSYIDDNIIKETSYLEKKTMDISEYECFNVNSLINKCYINDINNSGEKFDSIRTNIFLNYDPQSLKSLTFEDGRRIRYQITNSKYELDLLKSNNLTDDYDLSIIDLGECESKLKSVYGIKEEDSLIIVKQEKSSDKASEKDIQYEIYEPYNKTKLNLSICSGININVYVKLDLSDETKSLADEIEKLGYNMFDIYDPFYTDFCTPYKSKDKTDMLLSDRIDSIYNNNDARCQPGCKFSNYIFGSYFINCTCHIEQEEETLEDVIIDKLNAKTLGQSFYYVLKYSNYKILKCYKLVFVKSVFSKNKGAIIIFILFILYLMCLITHICRGIKPLKKRLGFMIDDKSGELLSYKNTVNFPPRKRKSSIEKKGHRESAKALTKLGLEKGEDKKYVKLATKLNSKSQFKEDFGKRKTQQYYSSKVINQTNISKYKSRKSKSKKRKESDTQLEFKEKNGKQYDDFELNELEYQEAVMYDNRSCFRVYISLLKREHRIIFTFFVCNDYNLVPVKLSRFIFLLATDMVMNVFFFSDATMHKIFLSYGKYDFIQQIPQIVYSTIVSQIIEVFLCYLSMTDTHIYEIKDLTIEPKNINVIKQTFDRINRKLFIYWLFTFIFFLGYWYIVAVFCAVYENTQIIFIKDSLISSVTGFIYPLILYTFPAAFRNCAIRCKNNKCLYKFSEIIPFF